jgi:hypothetical protein
VNREGSSPSGWLWLGLAAATIGFVATWMVQFTVSEDEMREGGAVLINALEDGNNEVLWRLSVGLGMVAAASLVGFAVAFRRVLEHNSPEGSLVPGAVQLGLGATAGALILAWVFHAMVFDSSGYYQPDSRVAIYALGVDTGLGAWAGVGIASTAVAWGGFREGSLPAWFTWLSAILSSLIWVLCFVGVPFPAHLPAMIWLAGASIAGLRMANRIPTSEGMTAGVSAHAPTAAR